MSKSRKLETLNDLIDYLIELRDEQDLGGVRVKREVVIQGPEDEWITSRYEPLCTDHIKVDDWDEDTDLPDDDGNYLKAPDDLREIHFDAGMDWISDYPELEADYCDEDDGECW